MAALVKELLVLLLHLVDSGCFLHFLDLQMLLFHQILLVLSCVPCEPVHRAEGILIVGAVHEVYETVNFLNVVKMLHN
jgi:hypothetical protein